MNLLNARSGVKALILKWDTVLILQKPSGKQDLQGGRVEAHETPEEALIREIMEETGNVAVNIMGPLAAWTFVNRSDLCVTGTTWLCHYLSGEISLSHEHAGFSWKPLSQLEGLEIYHKYGLDKFMVNFKTLSPERRKNYDRRLR